jgi:hypothetical protein
MEKLVRRGWRIVKADTLMYPERYIMFLDEEQFKKNRGYPRNSAVFKYAAEFIYDTLEKKFIKQRVEIAVSAAEEVLYGRSKDSV